MIMPEDGDETYIHRTAGIIWGQTHLESSMATCIKMFLFFSSPHSYPMPEHLSHGINQEKTNAICMKLFIATSTVSDKS